MLETRDRSTALTPTDGLRSAGRQTFLGRLEAAERLDLECVARRRPFRAGMVLIRQHAADRRVFLLLGGRVKAISSSAGREVMLSIRDAGDLLGELSYLAGTRRVATVSALDEVEALEVGAEDLAAYLARHPRLDAVLLELVALRCREEALLRVSLSTSDTLGRVAARIVELADRYGETGEAGIVIRSPLSHEDLAAWAGASRAGTAQALRDLRRLGWLSTSRGEIRVSDIDRLRARGA